MKHAFTSKLLGTICALLVVLPPAQATPLAYGQYSSLSLEPGPVGATLLATTNQAFTGWYFNNFAFSGSLASSVWIGDTSNPYGGLTFTYQLSNDSSSPRWIESFNIANYSGLQTDVGYNGVGTVPMTVWRADTRVFFRFGSNSSSDPWLREGLTSATLIIQTDSQVWDVGSARVNGTDGWSEGIRVFAPGAVPEPATLGLAIIGFSLLAVRKRL